MKAQTKNEIPVIYYVQGEREMYLDDRSNRILKEIIKNPLTTNKQLQQVFELSRRQIDYSLNKINDWLVENGQPKIEKINGHFRVKSTIIKLINPSVEEKNKQYILSEQERIASIILYILLREEELSLNHFIVELEVSKNTVLQDLKLVQIELEKFNLMLNYDRTNGYYIEGEEWNKRSLVFRAIHNLMNSYVGLDLLDRFMGIGHGRLEQIRKQLMTIENDLHYSFTDIELKSLPYIIGSIFRRIKQKKFISTDFFIDFSELSDTREYEAIKYLIEDCPEITVEEKLYLTLQILKSNTVSKKQPKADELPKLKNALRQCIELFEKKSVIALTDKTSLLEKLFLHFKPAYYRIKYRLTTDYRPLDKISQEFEMLHYFVKLSVGPLETFLEMRIPENELMFFTLFIGSHIIEKNERNKNFNMKRALVVCPNGLSISQLMEKNLLQLFPEIHFYPAMSIREYELFELEYDVVFSSMFLSIPKDKQLFIVDPVMGKKERVELRQRVMQSVYSIHEKHFDVNKVMEVIRQYSEIKDEMKLVESLEYLLNEKKSYKQTNKTIPPEGAIHLNQLLSETMIQIVDSVNDWHDAIQLASEPLITSGKIENSYITAMQELYDTVKESIVLNSKIAIPHAPIETGVKELGMSMLIIKEGIPNYNDSLLHIIVVIAAVDKKAHFTSLSELMALSGNENAFENLLLSKSKQEAYLTVNDFVITENYHG